MKSSFSQVATLENLRCVCHPKKKGRFYRVPFKSLLRIQIKWGTVMHWWLGAIFRLFDNILIYPYSSLSWILLAWQVMKLNIIIQHSCSCEVLLRCDQYHQVTMILQEFHYYAFLVSPTFSPLSKNLLKQLPTDTVSLTVTNCNQRASYISLARNLKQSDWISQTVQISQEIFLKE